MIASLMDRFIDRPLLRFAGWAVRRGGGSGPLYRLAAVLVALRCLFSDPRESLWLLFNTPRFLLVDFLCWIGVMRRVK